MTNSNCDRKRSGDLRGESRSRCLLPHAVVGAARIMLGKSMGVVKSPRGVARCGYYRASSIPIYARRFLISERRAG